MQKNRFFKSTQGISAETVIAQTIDNSATPVAGVAPAAATVTVTVAATPAVADKINITVNGVLYSYIIGAGDTTAALADASILAVLNANNQGFVATLAGTTSAVFTLTGSKGTAQNGWVVSVALGAPNVSTFSAASSTNFGAGGVDAIAGGAQPTIALFVANAASGALGVYWSDTNNAVKPGETGLLANYNRGFYYAWKTQDGNAYLTTPTRCDKRKYFSTSYSAGQADVWTQTFSGTYTAGQYLHIKIIDTTSAQIPYPNYEYTVTSTGTLATDLTALAALISAEIYDPIATATATATTLIITGKYNSRTIKVGYYLETVGGNGNAQGIDQTVCTAVHTTSAIAETGTTADMLETEKYFKIQNGIMIYTEAGILPSELSNISQLTVPGTQYGYVVVTGIKSYYFPSSPVPINENKTYIIIALPSTLINQLVGY